MIKARWVAARPLFGSGLNMKTTIEHRTAIIIDHQDELERRTVRKLLIYLVSFLGICYVTNLLDRFNLGYASLEMNKDLSLSPSQFGFAAGIFFVGYLCAELPSNMMLMRYGARVWLARIMVTWGIASSLTAFVHDAQSFYIIRFILGVAEAGFLPGVMLFLAVWVPAKHRSKAILLFFSLGQLAALLGPIFSAWILSGTGGLGFKNWQLMFVLEAIPTVILGVVLFFRLPDSPKQAKWLAPDERQWLIEALEKDSAGKCCAKEGSVFDGLRSLRVWALFLAKFANGLASFSVALWFPQIVRHSSELGILQTGLVVALPSILTIPLMWIVGNYSDRSGNRIVHAAVALFICATCSVLAALTGETLTSIAFVGVASISAVVATGITWAIAPSVVSGRAAAAGFAIINAGGILAGFAGGYVIGLLREWHGNFNSGFFFVAAVCLIGAFAVLSLHFTGSKQMARVAH